jgi:putative DNA primase/helicase
MSDGDRDWTLDDEPAHEPSLEELTEVAPRSTDSANADAIVIEHGAGYRYVIEWKEWIVWTGMRWEMQGAAGRVRRAAMLTARLEYFRTLGTLRSLNAELKPLLLDATRDADRIEALEASIKHQKQLLKWHEQSQNQARLEAAARILETRLVVAKADLDRDPWLFNVRNGTIDLRTGDLRDHASSDLITQLSDIDYDPAAKAPTWDAFIFKAMRGSMPMRLYLQRLVGYTLTGTTTEHVLVFHYGNTGSNGKSTFLTALRSLMGDYGCSAPRTLLFESRTGADPHPTELARLYGKRLATCSEVPENVELAEAKVKDLTGGDVLSVRRMNENFWDLIPSHTLHAAGNHKPIIKGTDGGIWRRIKLVPWLNRITDEEKDQDLGVKLAAERPGILAWAVRGCLAWQETGLEEPAEVTDAGAEYRSESDVLGAFFDNQCVFEAGARYSCKYLRKGYETWCEDMGHRSVGARILGRRLREKGVTDITVRVDGRPAQGWAGVRLKTNLEAGQLEDPHAPTN